MTRLLLPALFASLLLAAHILIGPSPVTTGAATALAILGLVCTRTEDRISRRTIRILAIVSGAGSVVAAVLLSSWFVVATVAFVTLYLRNGDEPKRVDCPNRFDSIVSNWCTANECACGLPVIPPPPPLTSPLTFDQRISRGLAFARETNDWCGQNPECDEEARIHFVTRGPDGLPLSVTPVFDSRANVLAAQIDAGFWGSADAAKAKADADLRRALAAIPPMSPADREEQRRSFAFGNASISNPSITRADIDCAALDASWDDETQPGGAA